MKRSILVITHGKFGIEIIKSAEMIMGPQKDVYGLGLMPGESVDDLRTEAFNIVSKNKDKGFETIILCDLLGGSPSNVALSCIKIDKVKIFTGLSLPMLIELLQGYKDLEDFDELLNKVKESAINGVKIIDENFFK